MKKILLVEDEQIIQVLCRRLLGQMGFDLRVAGSVAEAGEAIKDYPPDLLITDLRLPDGDGVEVIMLLKERAADAKVIIVTGSSSTSKIRLALIAAPLCAQGARW